MHDQNALNASTGAKVTKVCLVGWPNKSLETIWSRGILRCMSVGKGLQLIRQGLHAVKMTHADTLKKYRNRKSANRQMPIHWCIKAVPRAAGNARSNNQYREGGQADSWIFYLDRKVRLLLLSRVTL